MAKKLNILIVIPARGGSKGIPRKNLRLLGNQPLISYSIQNALAISGYDIDTYVSSEDQEILSISQKIGAKTFLRNPSLAGDAITLDAVIYEAYKGIEKIEGKAYDLIITMQPTSPLLNAKSVKEGIAYMIDHPETDTLISCKEDTHLSWTIENDEFKPNYKERLNRQYLKPEYRETGGFLITRNTIITPDTRIGNTVHLHELKNNKESIDIDTFEDWSTCEYYLKRKKILFVVTGNKKVGLGHVYNSTLVANDILEHEIAFLLDAKSQMGYDKIAALNFNVSIQKYDNIIDDIRGIDPDIVISDILDTDEKYIQQLKDAGIYTINFEDLGSGAQKADLVFNAIYPEKKKIQNHYFGPSYFLARDEFILSNPKEIKPQVSQVLLTFGGVDPANLSCKILETIKPICEREGIKIEIVLGFGYQNQSELKKLLTNNITLHEDINNISDVMLKADIAFTSGGRTTYELALLGVPTVVVCQNERELTHFFAHAENGFINLGLHSAVGTEDISRSFTQMLNFEKRQKSNRLMMANNIRNGRKNVTSLIKRNINEIA